MVYFDGFIDKITMSTVFGDNIALYKSLLVIPRVDILSEAVRAARAARSRRSARRSTAPPPCASSTLQGHYVKEV